MFSKLEDVVFGFYTPQDRIVNTTTLRSSDANVKSPGIAQRHPSSKVLCAFGFVLCVVLCLAGVKACGTQTTRSQIGEASHCDAVEAEMSSLTTSREIEVRRHAIDRQCEFHRHTQRALPCG